MEIKYNLTPEETEIARMVWSMGMSSGSISRSEWLATPAKVRAAVLLAMRTTVTDDNPFEKVAASFQDAEPEAVPDEPSRLVRT